MIMSNKLREMLKQREMKLNLSMKFGNNEDRNRFIKAVNQVIETGEPQDVQAPQYIKVERNDGDYRYPIDIEENIVDIKLFPSKKYISIPIKVNGEKKEYPFEGIRQNGKVVLHSVNSKVVEIKMVFEENTRTMDFMCTSHLENADTVDELIDELSRALALLTVVVSEESLNKKNSDIKKYLSNTLGRVIRIQEVCNLLKIEVTPKMVIEEDDKECLIDKHYLLLIKKHIIRQEGKINHIKFVNIEDVEPGQEVYATYFQTEKLVLFNEQRELFTVNCIVGAMIQKVETKDDGSSIVYFKDSETRPMFRSYSAYLNQSEAEEEMRNMLEKREAYENAESWTEQLQKIMWE